MINHPCDFLFILLYQQSSRHAREWPADTACGQVTVSSNNRSECIRPLQGNFDVTVIIQLGRPSAAKLNLFLTNPVACSMHYAWMLAYAD